MKKIPGMNPDNIIKSSIVPPTTGQNIPSLGASISITQFQAKDMAQQMQAKQLIHELMIRNPQMLISFPEFQRHIRDPSILYGLFGFFFQNNKASIATNLPTSELYQNFPEDFQEHDFEAVFTLVARGFPPGDVLEYYEACNRDIDNTYFLLKQASN